jgi:hypothetical protein
MSIPKLTDVVALWRDTIIADATLAGYCTGTLGAALNVYVGVDEKNPPKIGNAPFLVIVPIGTRPGYQEDQHTWSIGIHIGIEDATFSDYQGNGAVEMRGVYRIDQMYTYVQAALDAIAAQKNVTADMIQFTVECNAFPLIQAQALIECRLPNTIGINISL